MKEIVKKPVSIALCVAFFVIFFVHGIVDDESIGAAALSALLWTILYAVAYLAITWTLGRNRSS